MTLGTEWKFGARLRAGSHQTRLRPGQSIRVEDAIKGLVTRSANDAAVVIAEAIAGDEGDFARQMTRKARALGMTRTVYRNASGLPDDNQVTTARDQSTWAAPSRTVFRGITATSRLWRSTTAVIRSATIIACSATSRASMVSKTATPEPPASIS